MTGPEEFLDVAKAAARAGARVLSGRNGEALGVSNKGAAGDWVTGAIFVVDGGEWLARPGTIGSGAGVAP